MTARERRIGRAITANPSLEHRHPASGDGELLVLWSANHPNAVTIVAGRRLAEWLVIPEDRVSWQPLELQA